MYTIEEYDKLKTKVLKYIIFKKRTEKEIRRKFEMIEEQEMLEDVIGELKQIGYISDTNYIERAIAEFMALNNLSIKEIKYKLYSKGVSSNDIEGYILNHIEELEEYELKSARNIFYKKQNTMEKDEIWKFLLKKGYKSDNIKEALD